MYQNWCITQEQLQKIIRTAFKRGEHWGCCYQGWFTPDEQDTEQKIQECIAEIEKAKEN